MEEEKKSSKTKNGKGKKFWTYAGVVALVLAAVIISLLFYRQKIETTKIVLKNLTEDWQTFKSDKYGFSFKYPKDYYVTPVPAKGISDPEYSIDLRLGTNEEQENRLIMVRILDQRSVNTNHPADAIQISIPFDKQNYLIFSTSTNNDEKEVFYNIPVTLEIGK